MKIKFYNNETKQKIYFEIGFIYVLQSVNFEFLYDNTYFLHHIEFIESGNPEKGYNLYTFFLNLHKVKKRNFFKGFMCKYFF